MKKPSIGLINLGCSKNIVDSETMLGSLHKEGYNVSIDDNADIVIINTCSFINDSKTESIQTILETAQKGKKIIVAGCLAQRYQDELKDALPEVSAFIGTGNIHQINEVVSQVTNPKQKGPIFQVTKRPTFYHVKDIERFSVTTGASAYVKISEGCDYRCSFCIIPQLKGDMVSKPIEMIVDEVNMLTERGVKEVVLIAQDSTNYGRDLYGKPSLDKLLESLSATNISWIRIMYAYPSLMNKNILEVIQTRHNIVNYIDMPLQHAHPSMLKAMKRPNVNLEELISQMRVKVPNIALRTTFIVGFPGETYEHFNHLCEFVKSTRFDRVGVFKYSHEENTPSFDLPNQIPDDIKEERYNTLMSIQRDISYQINQTFVGQTLPVLIDYIQDDGTILGRSYRDAPEVDGTVILKDNHGDILPGDLIDIKITRAKDYDLYGVKTN